MAADDGGGWTTALLSGSETHYAPSACELERRVNKLLCFQFKWEDMTLQVREGTGRRIGNLCNIFALNSTGVLLSFASRVLCIGPMSMLRVA